MAKIVKDNSRIKKLEVEEFAHVEKGQKPYLIKSFSSDEEYAVQDPFDDTSFVPITRIVTVEEEDITDDVYLPPSKLAKASDNVKVEKVEFTNLGKSTDTFAESPLFADEEADEDEYPKKVISVADQPQEAPIPNDNNASMRVKVLEELLTQKEDEFNKTKAELEIEYNKKIDDARTDGYEKAKAEINSEYNANKEDYLRNIDKFNETALSKITDIDNKLHKLDDELPKIVLSYVTSIIGSERVLNDDFLINLIKRNIKKLEELKIIEFHSHPEDVELLKVKFPTYPIVADTTLIKGSVVVITKSGEVLIDIDKMIEDFGKSIDEEFRVSKEI